MFKFSRPKIGTALSSSNYIRVPKINKVLNPPTQKDFIFAKCV